MLVKFCVHSHHNQQLRLTLDLRIPLAHMQEKRRRRRRKVGADQMGEQARKMLFLQAKRLVGNKSNGDGQVSRKSSIVVLIGQFVGFTLASKRKRQRGAHAGFLEERNKLMLPISGSSPFLVH